MIYVGTDIVTISRIDKLIRENGERFLNRVYTKNEQNICNSKANPKIHYSGKFAAKEAVKKALLSYNNKKNIPFHSIEIHNKKDGEPNVILSDGMNCTDNLKISISHTEEYATAIAILEIK